MSPAVAIPPPRSPVRLICVDLTEGDGTENDRKVSTEHTKNQSQDRERVCAVTYAHTNNRHCGWSRHGLPGVGGYERFPPLRHRQNRPRGMVTGTVTSHYPVPKRFTDHRTQFHVLTRVRSRPSFDETGDGETPGKRASAEPVERWPFCMVDTLGSRATGKTRGTLPRTGSSQWLKLPDGEVWLSGGHRGSDRQRERVCTRACLGAQALTVRPVTWSHDCGEQHLDNGREIATPSTPAR